MAEMSRSMQATCVRPTTAVKQVVNQQQSTAAVQITITSAISAIAYMRELLPDEYFSTQYIGDSTSPLDYDRFVQDGNENHPRATQGSLVYMLKRGVSERADSLYDILENGIFDAIRKDAISTIRVIISADVDRSDQVLETYDISVVSSPPTQEVSRHNVGENAEMPTVEDVQSRIGTSVQKFYATLKGLPYLPKQRSLHFDLLPNQQGDPSYNPPHFELAVVEEQRWGQHAEWTKVTTQEGGVDAGYKGIGLEFSHLDRRVKPRVKEPPVEVPPVEEPPDEELSVKEPDQLPNNLQFSTPTPSPQAREVARRTRTPQYIQSTPSTIVEGDLDTSTQPLPENGISHSLQSMQLEPQETGHGLPTASQKSIQSVAAAGMREDLQRMLESEAATTGLPATQVYHSQSSQNLQASNLSYEASPQMYVEKPSLLVETWNMVQARSMVEPFRGKTETSRISTAQEASIKCPCGSITRGEDMLRCHFCGTLQHFYCHGFLSPTDHMMPTTHVCYHCLLDTDDERHVLRELEQVAVLRRAIHLIETSDSGGYSSVPELATLLGTDEIAANNISDTLRKRKKFIRDAPGSHSKGFSQRGEPRHVVTTKEKESGKMLNELYSPFTLISHLYNLPGSQYAARRLQATGVGASLGEENGMEFSGKRRRSSRGVIESIEHDHRQSPDELSRTPRESSGISVPQPNVAASEVKGTGGTPTQARCSPSQNPFTMQARQPPTTPCHKRPFADAEPALGPAARTRSAVKRQKWTQPTGFNMTDGFRTPG